MATPQFKRTMSATEWGLLVFLSVLWGGSFFFNGIAVKELPPLSVVTARVILAALVLQLVLRLAGQKVPVTWEAIVAFLGMGLLNNVVPFTLIVVGQRQLPSGLASILNATTPIWTVIVVHVLTSDDRMTGNRLAGVLIGFVGVAVMIGPEALGGLGDHLMAEAAVLGAAWSYAFGSVFSRRFQRMAMPPLVTATGQITASAIMMLPLALIVDRPWLQGMPGLATLGALTGLAVLSTALAYGVYFRILSTASVTNLSLVTFLIPVSAILLGVFVLGEHLDSRHIAGMSIIALGLAAIDGRLWRILTRGRDPART